MVEPWRCSTTLALTHGPTTFYHNWRWLGHLLGLAMLSPLSFWHFCAVTALSFSQSLCMSQPTSPSCLYCEIIQASLCSITLPCFSHLPCLLVHCVSQMPLLHFHRSLSQPIHLLSIVYLCSSPNLAPPLPLTPPSCPHPHRTTATSI